MTRNNYKSSNWKYAFTMSMRRVALNLTWGEYSRQSQLLKLFRSIGVPFAQNAHHESHWFWNMCHSDQLLQSKLSALFCFSRLNGTPITELDLRDEEGCYKIALSYKIWIKLFNSNLTTSYTKNSKKIGHFRLFWSWWLVFYDKLPLSFQKCILQKLWG